MGMMQMIIATTTGGTESALAAVDVPQDGNIIGLDWSVRSDLDADGEFTDLQLSFGSQRTAVNDSRQVISSAAMQAYLLTSGYGVATINKFVGPLKISVSAGERLYIHANSTAGVVTIATVIIYYDFDIGRSLQRRG